MMKLQLTAVNERLLSAWKGPLEAVSPKEARLMGLSSWW